MKVYRIAKWQYLEDLSGVGAKLYGGRWNEEGIAMLYTSAHLSLAVLELLANQVRRLVDDTYGYICIEIPDHIPLRSIGTNDLASDWRSGQYSDQTTRMGTQWIKSQESLGLMVPSAVLAQEYNILINPSHSAYDQLVICETGQLELDGRVAVS